MIEEWKQEKLGKIAKITMGQSPDGKTYSDVPSTYILVQGNADLVNGWVVPRIWTTQKTKEAHKGDTILSVRAPAGEVGKTAYDVVLGRGVAGIKANDFIYQLLYLMSKNGYWNKYATGSTFASLNSKDISEANIFITSDSEQNAIGKILGTIDNIVTLLQKKSDQLNTLKKALLQKMFADKEHRQPKLRFKGFSGDWEQKKLQKLVEIKSGLSTNTQKRDENYKITRIETISDGTINKNKVGTVNVKPDDKFLMHTGDILFSNINSLKHIGKVAIFDGSYTLYHGMNLLRLSSNSSVNPYFLFYELTTKEHKNWAEAHANPAVNQASINQHELSKEEMHVATLQEQEEIAQLLNKVMDTINLHQRNLAQLQTLKKHLLQNMFI